MQAAVDAAPEGGTIVVSAGVYTGPFRVEGKRLRIIGSDEGRTEIVSSSLEVPLATYVNGGGGELKNIVFRGGACAVCGSREGSSMPSALAVKNVTAAGGYRGAFGGFSKLDLKNVEVVGTRWHGISITDAGLKLTFGDIEVHDVGGVGLLVLNGGAGDIVVGGHFHDNAKGGVEILGHNGTVDLVLLAADHNHDFGVLLRDTNAGMALSSLAHNGHFTDTGCQGAGLWATNFLLDHRHRHDLRSELRRDLQLRQLRRVRQRHVRLECRPSSGTRSACLSPGTTSGTTCAARTSARPTRRFLLARTSRSTFNRLILRSLDVIERARVEAGRVHVDRVRRQVVGEARSGGRDPLREAETRARAPRRVPASAS